MTDKIWLWNVRYVFATRFYYFSIGDAATVVCPFENFCAMFYESASQFSWDFSQLAIHCYLIFVLLKNKEKNWRAVFVIAVVVCVRLPYMGKYKHIHSLCSKINYTNCRVTFNALGHSSGRAKHAARHTLTHLCGLPKNASVLLKFIFIRVVVKNFSTCFAIVTPKNSCTL